MANKHKTFNLNDAHCSPFQIALLLELVKLQKWNFGFKGVSKNVLSISLQSMINAKVSQQRLWACQDDSNSTPTTHICFKSCYLLLGVKIDLDKQKVTAKVKILGGLPHINSCRWNNLDKVNLIPVLKPLQTEVAIHHRVESCW